MFKASIIATSFALALSGAAFAQNNQGGGNNSNSEGLVNVTLGDVVLSQIAQDINVDVTQIPVTVQVPVGVAANVCGVDANVLAQQKKTGDAECDATSSSQALTQVVQRQMGTTQQ
jgi:hypothetical protein